MLAPNGAGSLLHCGSRIANGEFVACKGNLLDTNAQPYDPRFLVVCLDEQPVQLLKKTRVPIATKTHARCGDSEYERAGMTGVFVCTEPLRGWRIVKGLPALILHRHPAHEVKPLTVP